MASSVKDAAGAAEQAQTEVTRAEARVAGGDRGVTAEALHRLRDKFRHATLAAQGAQARAEQDRQQARTEGLAHIGAEVDKVAAADPAAALETALRDVVAAVARVWQLAGERDAVVAQLVDAARDLDVEPVAPGGARGSSAHVGVQGKGIVYKAVKLMPVREKVPGALGHALGGDVTRAVAELKPVTAATVLDRPDHLLRGRNGLLQPMWGPLNHALAAQVHSGDAALLSEHDIDLYMGGELL